MSVAVSKARMGGDDVRLSYIVSTVQANPSSIYEILPSAKFNSRFKQESFRTDSNTFLKKRGVLPSPSAPGPPDWSHSFERRWVPTWCSIDRTNVRVGQRALELDSIRTSDVLSFSSQAALPQMPEQVREVKVPRYERSRRQRDLLDFAYRRCREITSRYAKTFYLGTLLMPDEKRKAIWAIYVWCRRTDELVDGPRALRSNLPVVLAEWERRLEQCFEGRPTDLYDLALLDTLQRYPQDIQPYRDMIGGMIMDLNQNRYETFEDLKVYCYRVAGTVGLMSTAVMGTNEPTTDVSEEAIALGIANQLTNILRDVGEDARRGRIYLPLEDLRAFNYSEEDLMRGIVDDRWVALMQFQIARARKYFAEAESGIQRLHLDARYPVWASLMLYRQILDVIERNGYEVFRKRAYVPRLQKFLTLPAAFLKSRQQ
mmetsp:Transcript_43970/g.71536  ORF Transcript_43970/g.71536 Transcript_43970/m.71536 type:complete len:429 (-) Transcript_43970:599-1885(-)